MKEIRVGTLTASSDPATQLVQLTKSETFGSIDDESVHRWQVDAGLDDGGADEHVEASFPEIDHHPFERALVHLTVGDGDAGVGHQLAETSRDLIDVGDPIVYEEDLALAQQLAANRLNDGRFVVLANVGENRTAIGGRRCDHGEIANSGEGHLERARDRTRAEGQDVDAHRTALDPSLCCTPKRCSSSTTRESQLLEGHRLAQEPVRADDDVDRSVGEPGQGRFHLNVVDEATEERHLHGKAGEPFGEVEKC